MGKYFLKRILELIPKLLIITIVIFVGMQFIPGDPVTYLIPPDTISKLDPAQLEAMREKLGLNENVVVRYFTWLGNLLHGEFGYSLVSGASIKSMIVQRLPASFEVAIIALLISAACGLTFGFISATKQNSLIDYFNTILGMIGISVPEFFFGLLGISIFSLKLGWLPSGGRMMPGKEALSDRAEFLVLPCLCLAIGLIATLMRYTRGSMLDVLHKDYIKTARSKGLSEANVHIKHGLRNALIPIVVILVNRLPMLLGGAVVIESVFNYPGMGTMLLNAISGSDMPVVMITTMMIAMAILLASLLIDLISALLDPRIRFGKE